MKAIIRIEREPGQSYNAILLLPSEFCNKFNSGLGIRVAGESLGPNWGNAQVKDGEWTGQRYKITTRDELREAEQVASQWANELAAARRIPAEPYRKEWMISLDPEEKPASGPNADKSTTNEN